MILPSVKTSLWAFHVILGSILLYHGLSKNYDGEFWLCVFLIKRILLITHPQLIPPALYFGFFFFKLAGTKSWNMSKCILNSRGRTFFSLFRAVDSFTLKNLDHRGRKQVFWFGTSRAPWSVNKLSYQLSRKGWGAYFIARHLSDTLT